jgi:plastocyanin
MEDTRAHEQWKVRRGRPGKLRRALAILATGLVVGGVVADVGVAWADTFRVRAARQSDGTGWRWRPKHRYIADGDYIRWRNPTNRRHNVSAWGANWDYFRVLDPGESVRRQFNSTGTFRYRCTLHSSLTTENGVTTCSGQCGFIHVS